MNNTFQLLLVLLIAALVMCVALWIIAAIGALKITDGCLYRYSFKEDGTLLNNDVITDTVILKANGNYTVVDTGASSESLTLAYDPNTYGQWLNTHFLASEGKDLNIKITGEVSLCKSYVPRYNPMSDGNTDYSGNRIAIPRVDAAGTDGSLVLPLSYIMDAKTRKWRTIAEVYQDDKLILSLTKDRKNESVATQYNFMTGTVTTADCSDGSIVYNPICGRNTPYPQFQYQARDGWDTECAACDGSTADFCGCATNATHVMPEPYLADGTYTWSWIADLNLYLLEMLKKEIQINIFGYYIIYYYNIYYYTIYSLYYKYDNSIPALERGTPIWMSADNAAGMLYRFDTLENPTNATSLGSNYTQAQFIGNAGVYPEGSNYNVFFNDKYGEADIKYLQVNLHDISEQDLKDRSVIDDSSDIIGDRTGGYVVNIKHTKCRRVNGDSATDSFVDRGLIEYVILSPGVDANDLSSPATASGFFSTDTDGYSSIRVPPGENGNLWIRIKNNPADYVDSDGQYSVELRGEIERDSFVFKILNPILEEMKSKTKAASAQIFASMVCYRGNYGSASNCNNFFSYLRGILILYVMSYGLLFLAGSVQISQMDLVVRVVKIGLVAGLMNESTYNFFVNYVLDFVTSFSDEMIANMGGYSLFTNGDSTITTPLSFLDNVMTKIFLSTTFKAQVMALVTMGISGIIYFIIIFITLIIVVLASLRATAVYAMAYVAIVVLIGIAPLFLSFILFSFTRSLFENWVRFTFRYMIEPMVVLAGLIILVQLFTIYLDIVIGYSICWKCALGLKVPFIGAITAGFGPAFLDVPIFCFNWFAPWGHDNNTGPMGLNMGHIVALFILAYCMWAYVEFAGKLVARIAGSVGGPSAVGMGTHMADAQGNAMLKPIGFDKKSRHRMKSHAKKRANAMIRGEDLKQGPQLSRGSARMDRE